MQEVLIGAALFTGVVLVLALLIMAARARLVPSGTVTVNVNGERNLTVPVGGKLLNLLADEGILLPSACGGGATCGQCTLMVLEGGGALLPTERSHINRVEAARGKRLACQVTVMDDMRVVVPEDVFGVHKWTCTVRSNRSVATFIKELTLELPANETIEFRAGGYVQIESPPYELDFSNLEIPARFRTDWERFNLFALRSVAATPVTRAYSMANYPAENRIIMLNVRIATPPPQAPAAPPGVMSSYLFGLRSGDAVQCLRAVWRVLRARERCGDGVYRRRRGHGADALAHIRPAIAHRHRPPDKLLVRCAQPQGGFLHRGFRQAGGRIRKLQLASGPVRAASG